MLFFGGYKEFWINVWMARNRAHLGGGCSLIEGPGFILLKDRPGPGFGAMGGL